MKNPKLSKRVVVTAVFAVLSLILLWSCKSEEPKALPPPPPSLIPTHAAQALPEGHPPLPEGHPALPEGQPDISSAASSATSGPPIKGVIDISPDLKSKVGEKDTLYVMGRNDNGQLLVVKKVAKFSFPMDFELSGADLMVPGIAFDGNLYLSARIDKDTDAMPAAGDLDGVSERNPHKPGDEGVKILINHVRE